MFRPGNLCARILKSIYYPRVEFLKAKKILKEDYSLGRVFVKGWKCSRVDVCGVLGMEGVWISRMPIGYLMLVC